MYRSLARCAICATMLLAATVAHADPARDEEKKPQNFPETAAAKPAAPLSVAYPTEAAGEGTTTEGYNLHRWAEDWRGYKDPKKRDDILDRLKFLPLDSNGDVYLTLSGEARVRVNYQTNPGYKTGDAQRQDALRLVGGADLHIGPHFRFFGELASGHLGGENLGTPATNMKNDLVAQQYFAEAKADIGAATLGIRYGRQEFNDGAAQLVSQRDNNTIRFVLNGTRGWVRTSNLRADVFDFQFTKLGSEGLSDDKIDHGRRFSGVTTGYALPKTLFGKSKLYFEPFYWRLRTSKQRWGTQTATEERTYFGARLWGSAGDFNIDWTVNHQTGQFGTRDIDATQVFMAQTMAVGKSSWKPRVGVHMDYATGGGSNGVGKIGTAISPFGNGIYYSYSGGITPSNFIGIAPNVSFAPVKPLKVALEYQFAWRENENEPAYKGSGAAYAGTAGVDGKAIGQVARFQAVWSITKRLSFTARYEHVFTGKVLERANYRDSDYLAGWLNFRF